MPDNTAVAILLATYNGEKYLSELFDSLLKQTYKNWKLYIHDDGSKDNTLSIINEFVAEHPLYAEYVEGPPTGGAKNNFLFLVKKIESEIYMFCDQDDVWLPDKIEATLKGMESLKEKADCPCLVHTDLKIVDEKLDIIANSIEQYQKLHSKDSSVNHLLVENVVTGCTAMINRNLRDKMIEFTNIDNIIMHDWWAALIAAQFGEILFIPNATILYRQHGNNTIGAKKTGLLDVFKGSKRNHIRNLLKMGRAQAKELSSAFKLNESSLASIYANVSEYNKLKRICIYIKHNFKANTFLRTLGLYVLG